MRIQISSGQGPAECEHAVYLLCEEFKKEFSDITVESIVSGAKRECYKSVVFATNRDLSFLEGSVQWICKSPYRKGHKRKNWYVDISMVNKAETQTFDDSQVRFETFRCSGKGGQHVNKVETGVRAVYLPLGLSVEATEARSQHMNRKLALDRLCALIAGINQENIMETDRLNWLEHTRLERGNPIRVYESPDFNRVK